MKLGITIRPDMGSMQIIKDGYSLIEYLRRFEGRVGFIEIYCVYPMPKCLENGLTELKKYCTEMKIDINLHFPVEWHDRWSAKLGFEKLVKLICDFARECDSQYIKVSPGDIVHFMGLKERREFKAEALTGLKVLAETAPCAVAVNNGITIFEYPEDLDYFTKHHENIGVAVNVCHADQAVLSIEEFTKYFDTWKNKFLMLSCSDNGERAHLALGDGEIDFSFLRGVATQAGLYGICMETLSIVEDELLIRNPTKAIEKSLLVTDELISASLKADGVSLRVEK